MLLLALVACSPAEPLTRIAGANRVTELANGELLVGTRTGELWTVTTFGEATRIAEVPGAAVAELVSDPLGRFWVRLENGDVYSGGLWSPPVRVGTGSARLLRLCHETRWLTDEEAGSGVTALSLGHACDGLIAGTQEGAVDGNPATDAPITRVQALEQGALWVDAGGGSGCLGCEAKAPTTGVVDALSLHLPPFVTGEVVWIDLEGALWIVPA